VSFSDAPAVVADELARRLESQPAVVATDRLSADVSLSGRETVEATVRATDRGSHVIDEVASHAGNLGGEPVIHVPPTVAKTLNIEIGDAVTIEMQDGRAVLRADQKAEGRR